MYRIILNNIQLIQKMFIAFHQVFVQNRSVSVLQTQLKN